MSSSTTFHGSEDHSSSMFVKTTFDGSEDRSSSVFGISSEMFQPISNTMDNPSEDYSDLSSKDDVPMVDGLSLDSPGMSDTMFRSDNSNAASFCEFLAANSDTISDEANRYWGEMSSTQRSKFATDCADVGRPVTKVDKRWAKAKNPETAPMNEGLFGNNNNVGDEAFSNFLKEYQLRYGDVFNSKEILDAAKRQWNNMPHCEPSQPAETVITQRACPRPRRMACPKPRKPKCARPRSAKKKCAKPRAARHCPRPRSAKKCHKPRSAKKCAKPRAPRCKPRSVKCVPRGRTEFDEFGTKLVTPIPQGKGKGRELQEGSAPAGNNSM